jgi:hypothetical protein
MGVPELPRLKSLFERLPAAGFWAVVFEAGSGAGVDVVRAEPSDVFRVLSPRVRRDELVDVTVVVHVP